MNKIQKCAICGAPYNAISLDTFRFYICESCNTRNAEYIARERAALNGQVYRAAIQKPEPSAPTTPMKYRHCARVRAKKQYTREMSNVIHNKYPSDRYIPMLGCTSHEFIRHIESQFRPGMSWDNYNLNGWHIDHYIPFSHFDFRDPEDMAICWNYRNLRPLWGQDNLDKGTSLPPDYKTVLHIYAGRA